MILKTPRIFGQIYKDLLAHSEAEEQVVYPAVRPSMGTAIPKNCRRASSIEADVDEAGYGPLFNR